MTLYIIVWSVWCLSEVFMTRLLHSGKREKQKRDRGSLLLIWFAIAVAICGGVLCSIKFPVLISHSPWIPLAGLLLIVAGMAFRFTAIRALGRMFTVDVTIREDHKIKKDGLYRIIRHPAYLGSLISFLGFGISMNNWISLAVANVAIWAAMIYRIKVEEKALMEHFGESYTEYMGLTWRLIPWIY